MILVSIVGCGLSLMIIAGRNSDWYPVISDVDLTNIWHFMFTYSEGDNMRAKGTLWRVVLMYGFFIFGGMMGLLNWIPSIRKGLDKKSFISFCSSYWLLMILNFRWRSLILGTTIFILNILWVCFICIFDLSSTSFKSKTVSYLYSVSSYWLNLLWSLSVWIVSIESFIGFTVHAKYTLATNIQRFLCHFLYFCWSLGKSNLYAQDRWWHYLCRDYSSYHSRIRKVVLIPFG